MRRVLLALLGVHFAAIIAVSGRDTFAVMAKGETIFPNEWKPFWVAAEDQTKVALGATLSRYNPLRETIGAYLNAAGVESGYGFFAPNIPVTNTLTFELNREIDSVPYEVPVGHGSANAFRISSLLDMIGRVEDESVREGLIKYLAFALWREHSDADSIRAVLGTINFPSPAAYASGARARYDVTHVYDFKFEPQDGQSHSAPISR